MQSRAPWITDVKAFVDADADAERRSRGCSVRYILARVKPADGFYQ